MKTCRKCGQSKPLTEFYAHAKATDGHQSYCKVCTKKTVREYELLRGHTGPSPEENRAIRLQNKFGITIEQYDEMFQEQQGRCAICNRHQIEFTKRFAVDHDHALGYNRALLCSNCNVGLGLFKDNKETLENAIAYLERFEV